MIKRLTLKRPQIKMWYRYTHQVNAFVERDNYKVEEPAKQLCDEFLNLATGFMLQIFQWLSKYFEGYKMFLDGLGLEFLHIY